MSTREQLEFDVVIVGAGPAGLSAACKLAQLNNDEDLGLSICVIEKGSEVGAHILSGAVFETSALDELFPDWKNMSAPVNCPVNNDEVYVLSSEKNAIKVPHLFVPSALNNKKNHIISLANLCRWLCEQAEALGVEILAGFPASEILYDEQGSVSGVITGDMGRDHEGQEKPMFEAGYELTARYTLFAEGCRGHLGKELIARFALDKDSTPQHYGLGIKEIWEIPEEQHSVGKVVHGIGWPLGLGSETTGGFFLYHLENRQVAVGLITDLNYSNPWLSPFEEFQRLKHHPLIQRTLQNGSRLVYGARALTKGGLQSLPKSSFPGGLLIGDDAGLLNVLKLKGSHTAMKSGMLAAQSIAEAVQQDHPARELTNYTLALASSSIYQELHQSRNCGPALHKFGSLLGSAYCFIDQLFKGKLPFTFKDNVPDHETLKPSKDCKKIEYQKADNKISFDRLSSVYISNTNHEEDQPCHLQLADKDLPIRDNWPRYNEPAQRYCPAAVYEVLEENDRPQFQINAQNCVHCKTCDIKDPGQNIRWVSPEGGGGPNYPNM